MRHEFSFSLAWKGDTATPEYNRGSTATAPGKSPVALSSAPQYKGDPASWNPEELLGLALANCHMLTFLALSSKNGIHVRAYHDTPVAVLGLDDKVTCVTEIRLTPTIQVARGTDLATARTLFEKAHKHCFVANSIKCHVVMEPAFAEV